MPFPWQRLGAGIGLLIGSGLLGNQSPVALKSLECQGCHAMEPSAARWKAGNHARAATCSDCHLPFGPSISRTAAQAAMGMRHLAATPLGASPEGIRLKAAGAAVIQTNCLRCHPRIPRTAPDRPASTPLSSAHADADRPCLDCHRETAHAHTGLR